MSCRSQTISASNVVKVFGRCSPLQYIMSVQILGFLDRTGSFHITIVAFSMVPVFRPFRGPFSAVATPVFASKFSFSSFIQISDLQDCLYNISGFCVKCSGCLHRVLQISAQFHRISREEADFGKNIKFCFDFCRITRKFRDVDQNDITNVVLNQF